CNETVHTNLRFLQSHIDCACRLVVIASRTSTPVRPDRGPRRCPSEVTSMPASAARPLGFTCSAALLGYCVHDWYVCQSVSLPDWNVSPSPISISAAQTPITDSSQ